MQTKIIEVFSKGMRCWGKMKYILWSTNFCYKSFGLNEILKRRLPAGSSFSHMNSTHRVKQTHTKKRQTWMIGTVGTVGICVGLNVISVGNVWMIDYERWRFLSCSVEGKSQKSFALLRCDIVQKTWDLRSTYAALKMLLFPGRPYNFFFTKICISTIM